MSFGFTGTRDGMTLAQKQGFLRVLQHINPPEFHHGDCVGSDGDALCIVTGFNHLIRVICHPPTSRALQLPDSYCHERRPRRSYLERNAHIVEAILHLVATPKEMEMQFTGGTWYTIKLGLARGRRVTIIYPDGSIKDTPARINL